MSDPVPGRPLDHDTLGAWLVKARPELLAASGLLAPGPESRLDSLTSRCVRPSYRTDLIRAGQPVLLWLSGRDPQFPAGVHAVGTTTGPVVPGEPEPSMPVRLHAIDHVVTRAELLAHPGLRDIEVLRMPAGSNPSYVDAEHYGLLLDDFPQLRPS